MAFGHEKLNVYRAAIESEVCDALPHEHNAEANQILNRMVVLLTKLGKRGYTACESSSE